MDLQLELRQLRDAVPQDRTGSVHAFLPRLTRVILPDQASEDKWVDLYIQVLP